MADKENIEQPAHPNQATADMEEQPDAEQAKKSSKKKNKNKIRNKSPSKLVPGVLVLAPYVVDGEEIYYEAKVTRELAEGMVEVRFIEDDIVIQVPSDACRPAQKEQATASTEQGQAGEGQQAIRAQSEATGGQVAVDTRRAQAKLGAPQQAEKQQAEEQPAAPEPQTQEAVQAAAPEIAQEEVEVQVAAPAEADDLYQLLKQHAATEPAASAEAHELYQQFLQHAANEPHGTQRSASALWQERDAEAEGEQDVTQSPAFNPHDGISLLAPTPELHSAFSGSNEEDGMVESADESEQDHQRAFARAAALRSQEEATQISQFLSPNASFNNITQPDDLNNTSITRNNQPENVEFLTPNSQASKSKEREKEQAKVFGSAFTPSSEAKKKQTERPRIKEKQPDPPTAWGKLSAFFGAAPVSPKTTRTKHENGKGTRDNAEELKQAQRRASHIKVDDRHVLPPTMKALRLLKHPKTLKADSKALSHCFEVVELEMPMPREGEVIIKVEYSPINPSDTSTIKGGQSDRGLPMQLGFEASGTVVASGGGLVGWLRLGQRVAAYSNNGTMWADYAVVGAATCVPLPPATSFLQGSSLFINPLTALAFLEIVQNSTHKAVCLTAAASQVGRMMIRLCVARNIPVVAVVRRQASVGLILQDVDLDELSATQKKLEFIVTGEENYTWADKFRVLCHRMSCTVLFDAVAGSLLGTLLHNMPKYSEAFVYGGLAGESCSGVSPTDLIFQHKILRGFWLTRYFRNKSLVNQKLFLDRAASLLNTELRSTFRAAYPLEQIGTALHEYALNSNTGKIVLCPGLLHARDLSGMNQITHPPVKLVAASSNNNTPHKPDELDSIPMEANGKAKADKFSEKPEKVDPARDITENEIVDEMPKAILVCGATGTTGVAICKALSAGASESYQILAAVRNKDSNRTKELRTLRGVTLVEVDMSKKQTFHELANWMQQRGYSLESAIVNVPLRKDRVKIGVQGLDQVAKLGTKKVVMLSVASADGRQGDLGTQFATMEAKTASLGVPWINLRLPMYVDNNLGNRVHVINSSTFYGPSDPAIKYSAVTVNDAGEAVANLVTDHYLFSLFKNKAVDISCELYSNEDLANALSNALGREVQYCRVPYDQARASMIESGWSDWQADGVIEQLRQVDDTSNQVQRKTRGARNLQVILGRQPTSVQQWVFSVAEKFARKSGSSRAAASSPINADIGV